MKFTILMGSPKLKGNTAELVKPFMEQLRKENAEVKYVTLADKKINSCKGCYKCQDVENEYGCVQKDDMYEVVDDVMWADCVIFATPIYSWYCTAEMKAVLDRLFGMSKYYRSTEGSLWNNKYIGIIATHGYTREYATDPFEIGMQRFCEHNKLNYIGMFSFRDINDLPDFQTKEAKDGAGKFAREVIAKIKHAI